MTDGEWGIINHLGHNDDQFLMVIRDHDSSELSATIKLFTVDLFTVCDDLSTMISITSNHNMSLTKPSLTIIKHT